MATVYHRDQTGAPSTFSTAAYSQIQFTNLKEVLIACLVSGYEGTPAAGWELIAQGGNYLILRNGSHTGYVGLTWYSGGVVRLYMSETFTGVNASGVLQGLGLKTGTGANNALPHAIGLTYFNYSSGTSSWYCVADEKTFVLAWVGNSSNRPLDGNTPTNYPYVIYVGEDSEGYFIAVGGQLTTSVSNGQPICGFGANGPGSTIGFTALRNPVNGLLVDTGSIAPQMTGVMCPNNHSSPSDPQNSPQVVKDLHLGKASWYNFAAYAGDLRGIAPCLTLINARMKSDASGYLGMSPPMTSRQANTLFNLGDGHAYFLGIASTGTSCFFVTDNPEYWQ